MPERPDKTRMSRLTTIVLWMLALTLLSGSGIAAPVVAMAPASDITRYDLDVSFDPESRTLAGSMTVVWSNTTGGARDTLYFRLYPNAAHYGDGQTEVSSVTVDGQPADSALWPDTTVLEVDLGQPVPSREDIVIGLAFETTIPATSGASFGILGGERETGWWLADWHPILAGWEDGSGWYLDPPTRFGDPTFAESATYDLVLTAPDEYVVLGSGSTADATVDDVSGMKTTTVTTPPGRDLTLSLPLAADTKTTVRLVAGFAVRVTLPDGVALPGLAGAILAVTADTLPVYESWLGEYPGDELDITAVPLAGAGGVSWNGIVWLDLAPIVEDGELSAGERERLRFVLTHELSHQWIGGIVGSNNNDHGFMTEGLANALTVLAIREREGVEGAERYLREWVASGYRGMLEAGRDGIADAPLTDDTDIAARGHLVYGKAALGFEAIRQAIGDEAFFAGLERYARDERFAISTPDDLRHAFEEASGADLGPPWSLWFEERATTVADIDAVLDSFASASR